MSRTIESTLAAEIVKPELNPIFLAKIETAGDTVFAWTGIGDLVWNGDTYAGTGIFGGVSSVEETTDGAAAGLVFQLSGIPDDIVATSIGLIRHGKPASLWMGCLDSNGVMVGNPLLIFNGSTDVPELEDGADTATIRLSAESPAIDQRRARVRRYTTEDQKIDYPTDKGFEYVEGLQDRSIPWGKS